MGRTEGIIDIQIAQFGQGPGEGLVVFRLLLMEPQVFQQQHLTRPERRNSRRHGRPDTVVGKSHGLAQQHFQCSGTWF